MREYTDKERLDFLQEKMTGYGNGWLLRGSTTGRGLRLHETSQDGAVKDVRQAIDNFMDIMQTKESFYEEEWNHKNTIGF